MTRIQNPTVQLPTERLEQIKAIGAVLGLSIADTLGHLIRGEIAKGTIADTLPGVSIQRADSGVAVAFDESKPIMLDRAGAEALAETVDGYTKAGRLEKLFNLDHDFIVERKGNGVKVTIPLTEGITKSFSVDVARDFARLVAAAVR